MSKEKPKQQQRAELFYDLRDQGFVFRLNGRYVKMKKADLKMHLRVLGYRDDEYVKTGLGTLPAIDVPFYDATQERPIDYADSLAGHRTGIFKDGAARSFLVTDEARGVWDDLPKKITEPKFFISFIQELLGNQAERFCYWLAIGLRSLRREDFRPGQMVALCGPAGCGKSLLQSWTTEIFGGRSADPYRYMAGLTQFNKDLAGAEHLAMEDPPTTTDIRTRRQFGAMLKALTVNRNFSIHQKGKDALDLPVWHRLTLSVNNETENIAILPPMDDSIQDKVFLFLCAPVVNAFNPFRGKEGTPNLLGEEFQGEGELDRKATWEAVLKETPIVRAWLLKEFNSVPKNERHDRFGIRAWHHPELLAQLSSLAPEMRMLNVIDMAFFSDDPPHTKWEGKTIELEQKLHGSKYGYEADKLFRFHNACGTYMGRLARSCPERISQRKLHGYTLWTINPPCSESKDTNGIVQ